MRRIAILLVLCAACNSRKGAGVDAASEVAAPVDAPTEAGPSDGGAPDGDAHDAAPAPDADAGAAMQPICPIVPLRRYTVAPLPAADFVSDGTTLTFLTPSDLTSLSFGAGPATPQRLNTHDVLTAPSMLRQRGLTMAFVNRDTTAGTKVKLFDVVRAFVFREVTIAGRVLGLDLTDDGVYWLEGPDPGDVTANPIVEGATLKRWLTTAAQGEVLRTNVRAAVRSDLRVAGQQAFWRSVDTGSGDATIDTFTVGGGAPAPLAFTWSTDAPGTSGGQPLAVDAMFVYFVGTDGTHVQRVRRTGGTVETLAVSASPVRTPVAIDDRFVYWAATDTMAVSKAGGAAFSVSPLLPMTACRWPVADGQQLVCGTDGGVTALPAWWRACSAAELSERTRVCTGSAADAGTGAACEIVTPARLPGPSLGGGADFQSDGDQLVYMSAVNGVYGAGLAGGGSTLFAGKGTGASSLRVRGRHAAFFTKARTIFVGDLGNGTMVDEITPGGAIVGLALTDDAVYWIEAATPSLKRKRWASPDVETLADGLSVRQPDSFLSVDGGEAFWIGGNSILSWKIGPGPVLPTTRATLVAVTLGQASQGPRQLAVDASGLYFVDGNRLRRVARDDVRLDLVSDPLVDVVGDLALDDEYVYWAAGNAGTATVMAARKADLTTFSVMDVTPATCTTLVADAKHLTCTGQPDGNGRWTLTVLGTWWRSCTGAALADRTRACGTSLR